MTAPLTLTLEIVFRVSVDTKIPDDATLGTISLLRQRTEKGHKFAVLTDVGLLDVTNCLESPIIIIVLAYFPQKVLVLSNIVEMQQP